MAAVRVPDRPVERGERGFNSESAEGEGGGEKVAQVHGHVDHDRCVRVAVVDGEWER